MMSRLSTSKVVGEVTTLEPQVAARAIGLVYVQDRVAGYRRERSGRGFRYRDPNGALVRDKLLLRRFAALAIPPAWTSVWICDRENGHLQATGFDARGRKQYRYHPQWRVIRDANKYDRLGQFAAALPRLRRAVQRALKLPGLPREKVLAVAVRLLDIAGIRVGNREYQKSNGSFGLTTLQTRHATVTGGRIRLRFRGKSGLPHEIDVHDPHLARIVRRCSELPGQRLFQFLDDDGLEHPIESHDVNAIIQQWTGGDFTAKDFRTWNGTVCFLRTVCQCTESQTIGLTDAIKQVACALGNTPAVCRKHYVHPLLVEQFVDGSLRVRLQTPDIPTGPRGLNPAERLLLRLLPKPQTLIVAKKRVRKSRVVLVARP